MTSDLATTNMLLGIMAAVSLLEALMLVGLFAGGFVLYRRLMRTVADLESKHVAPASARINAILDDVRDVTSVVRGAADSTDSAVRAGLAWLVRRFGSVRRAA
jgi:pyrimidine operon attenuation protein/uracil phosphoribosyltransferase